MNRTRIEWCDYTWNPITGCYGPGGTKAQPKHCSYCYARRIATRFTGTKAWPNGFEPTFHKDRLLDLWRLRQEAARIFVCSMSDLFGDWVPRDAIRDVITMAETCPWHTLIFLTKNPKRLAEFNPWPRNCWVGATATGRDMAAIASMYMGLVSAPVRFLSCEPLLGPLDEGDEGGRLDVRLTLRSCDWVIIGAQTQPLRLPERSWVEHIERTCDAVGIPVFEKNSLAALFPERELRQEWPKC